MILFSWVFFFHVAANELIRNGLILFIFFTSVLRWGKLIRTKELFLNNRLVNEFFGFFVKDHQNLRKVFCLDKVEQYIC